MTGNFCTACGTQLATGANFCPSCGAKVGAAGAELTATGGAGNGAGLTAASPTAGIGKIMRAVRPPRAILGVQVTSRIWLLLGAGLVVAAVAAFFVLSSRTLESDLTLPHELILYAALQAIVFLLFVRFLDLYEREPLILLGLMALWGAVGATFLALIGNDFVDTVLSKRVGAVFGAAISAPPVEEGAKGLALVVAFFVSRWASRRFGILEFDGLTDGIVYGAAIGIGFAFAEDILYMVNFLLEGAAAHSSVRAGYSAGESVFLMRRDFFGPMMPLHAISTASFGAGLGLATWSKRWIGRIGFPVLGLLVAMLIHATRNGFAELVLVVKYGWANTADWMTVGVPTDLARRMAATYNSSYGVLRWIQWAFLVAFFAALIVGVRYQRRIIREELRSEVAEGTLTPEEWQLMPEYLQRSRLYWTLLGRGQFERWRLRRRIDGELADLASLKWRVRNAGADPRWLDVRRRRIANLRAHESLEEGLQGI